MTDINVDELIAEARWVADEHEGAEWEPDAIAMIHRLADALEAVKRERDEALAVIERAKGRAHECYRSDLTCISIEDLAATPADALRERDAEKWDEGFDRGFYSGQAMPSADASESPVRNPYREEADRG